MKRSCLLAFLLLALTCAWALDREIGYFDTPGSARYITVIDSIAFVADSTGGMHIVDVRYPESPGYIGGYETFDTAKFVTIADSIAYIASQGMTELVDISDMQHPQFLGMYQGFQTECVAVNGHYMYRPDPGDFCDIVDVSDPTNPLYAGPLNVWGFYAIAKDGNRLYLTDWVFGLYIYNCQIPEFPHQLGVIELPDQLYWIAPHGDIVYVACADAGVCVVDVSNPYEPVLTDTVYLMNPRRYEFCYASNSFLFMTDIRRNVVLIYDIADPAHPEFRELLDPGMPTYALCVDRGVLYMANGTYGVHMLDLSDLVPVSEETEIPRPNVSLGNFPNPFNPETTIRYNLPSATSIELSVFNSRGQLVRTLVKGVQPEGEHCATWDGKDSDRNPMPTGVYFSRLHAAGIQKVGRMILLK